MLRKLEKKEVKDKEKKKAEKKSSVQKEKESNGKSEETRNGSQEYISPWADIECALNKLSNKLDNAKLKMNKDNRSK